jgi:lipoprotein-anchoring transpeptidase ErfK/SrfK
MPNNKLSRRSLLKLSGAALLNFSTSRFRVNLPTEDNLPPLGQGRVTIPHIRVYAKPTYNSTPVDWRKKDQILDIHTETIGPDGPAHNPLWYRITGGYAHSGYIQRIDNSHLNSPATSLPVHGQLGEITVPYITSMRKLSERNWEVLYRLYYQSIHWVTDIFQGPDKNAWYEITDELLHIRYYVPAACIRLIADDEISPISKDIPGNEKRIEISLRRQTLTAFEANNPIFSTSIASGIPSSGPTENGIPTDTPKGKYYISLKMPSKHMGDGEITSDLDAYELLGVPWSCFFVSTGVACHGTYWHNNFGTRMSHGCVNMRNEDALWLFRWTTPTLEPGEMYVRGRGTLVYVF